VRSHLEGDDVGFIRVTQFNEQTTGDLKKAITDLSTQAGDKLKGFIIDLRNNPGGLLDQAVSVSDAFLDKGEIVSIRGRTAEETQRFNARGGDLTKNKPLIVLINGGSASASEIVAGALQDHRRSTVIGTRSFGKGSVQTIIPLGSGNGALRLTTARYFTPSGRSIQAKGISPDIEVLQDVPEELKARTDTRGEASLRGHLKPEGDEQTGSQSYIPPDRKDDKALLTLATRFRFKIGCYGPRCGPELANTSSSQSPLVFVGVGGRPHNRPLCYAWRQNMAGCLTRGRDTGLKLGLNLLGDFLEISACGSTAGAGRAVAQSARPAARRDRRLSPEVLKSIRRKLGVAHRVLDVLVPEPSL
jgi:Peptidase family S41